MASVTTNQRLGVNSSMAVKVPCVVCSTANITLSGEQTIDGVAVVTDDRVLVTGQTDASENGIYDADTGAWTRSPDWDGPNDVVTGTTVRAFSGTANSGYWIVTTTGTITPGTTSVAFTSSGTLGDFSDTTSAANGDALIGGLNTKSNAEAYDYHEFGEGREIIIGVDYGNTLSITNGTDDWTTAINNAFTDAKAGDTITFKPGGTYGINTAGGIVLSSKTGVTINGNGAILKVLTAPTQTITTDGGTIATCFLLDTCDRCIVEKLELDGNNLSGVILGLDGCTNCTIQYNEAHNGGVAGGGNIFSHNGLNNKFLFNKSHNSQAAMGIKLGRGGSSDDEKEDGALVQGNICYSNTTDGIGGGMKNSRIIANHCYSNTLAGIQLANTIPSHHVVIANNNCHDNGGNGIQPGDSSLGTTTGRAYEIIVDGNICNDNTSSGIYMLWGDKVSINNNTCIGNNVGIVYAQNQFSTCTNNRCHSNSQNGITINNSNSSIATGTDISFNTNTISSVTTDISEYSDGHVVYIEGSTNNDGWYTVNGTPTSTSIVVDQSLTTEAAGASVVIQGAGTWVNVVSGNNCHFNTFTGIQIVRTANQRTRHMVINDNICCHNVLDGILFSGNGVGDAYENVQCANNVLFGNNTAASTNRDITIKDTGIYERDNLALTRSASGNSFTDGDTTPSVKGFNYWKTANTGATTITDFDDGYDGQEIIIIINDANTTIDFTASGLKGNAGVDWSPTTGDHMRCVYDGTDWFCDVSDNTA